MTKYGLEYGSNRCPDCHQIYCFDASHGGVPEKNYAIEAAMEIVKKEIPEPYCVRKGLLKNPPVKEG